MKQSPQTTDPPFRFRTISGQVLTYRIKEIEALAMQQLREGIGEGPVLIGATALLNLACEGVRLN